MLFFEKNVDFIRKKIGDCLIYINFSLLYSSLGASVDSTYKYRKIRLNSSAILEADTFFK